MFYINNKPLLVDEATLITLLRSDINLQNIFKLRDIKRSGNNIMVTCPNHSDGQEKSPSCGVYIDNKKKPICVHCFSCGYKDTLEGFVSNCFNKKDNGKYGTEWLNGFASIYQDKSLINKIIVPDRSLIPVLSPENSFIINDNNGSNSKHEYMYQRRLTDEIISLFSVYYDDTFKLREDRKPIECICFPVKDEYGRYLFTARRAINSKLFHYPKNVDKPIYGAYECIQAKARKVYVCESIIDALTIWSYGLYAVALIGTGSGKQYKDLSRFPFTNYVLALDGDKAGNNGRLAFKEHVKNKIISDLIIEDGKDVNDYSKEDFMLLEERLV